MKISGFTFIRNAVLYEYPIVPAIRSVLPLCDEVVVAVGESEDTTLELIQNIDSPKIKILRTEWDDTLRAGGRVLAEETNKALHAISPKADWALYIQGDEVLHEAGISAVLAAAKRWKDDPRTDGLLFNYRHFYGSYDYVGTNSRWYPHEIRMIKNRPDIYSYRDAQGFRKGNNEKLRVRPVNAYIHHYGWVKPPAVQQRKRENFNKYWHSDAWMRENVYNQTDFAYTDSLHRLERFTGTHPQVMQASIGKQNWEFDRDISLNRTPLKERLKAVLKKYLGLDFSYRNYRILR